MEYNKFAVGVSRAIVGAISFLMAYAWAAAIGGVSAIVYVLQRAGAQASGFALSSGPSPASMQSGQAPQASQVIHYNAKFTKNLKARTPAQRVCSRRPMPLNAGQKYRDFMYTALPANTTEASEGTVGSGIQVAVQFQDYTLGQWADFSNFSDFVLSTTIDPMVENVEREMAYRCARTIQKLTLAVMDSARSVDSRVYKQDATVNTALMGRNSATAASGGLRGTDVQPLEGMGRFGALLHPYFTTDMMVDTSNNSYVDILKHTVEGQMALTELPSGEGGEAQVLSMAGVTFLETTQVTASIPAWSGGDTALRTYIVGEDGVLAVRLERPDKTAIGDGEHKNLKLWRGKYAAGSAFDPAGLIGGGCSYNIVGTWGLPPDPTMRLRAYDYVPQNT